MSKIPQGEWNAIAARYQNGESISKIARGYGCTPPAIHYILKRNRLRPAEIAPQAIEARPAEAGQTRVVRANAADPVAASAFYPEKFTNGARGPALVRAGAIGSAQSVQSTPSPLDGMPPTPALPLSPNLPDRKPAPPAGPPSSALPGLDSELHLRAETAIETFRSSFDAALSEGSPGVCERLRQAASDLMKVAARTTMVLDRLNAIKERPDRAHNYPRSAHASDDFGKRG